MMTNKPIQQQHQPLKKYNTTSGLIEVTSSSLLGDEESSNRPSNNNKPVVVVVEKKKKTSLTAQQDVSPPPPPITRISDSSSTTTSSSSISKQFTPPPPPNYLEESTVAQKEAVAVPKELKSRLYHIFAEIEKEFDALYQENALLREQLFLFNCNNSNNNNNNNNINNSDSNQYNNRYSSLSFYMRNLIKISIHDIWNRICWLLIILTVIKLLTSYYVELNVKNDDFL